LLVVVLGDAPTIRAFGRGLDGRVTLTIAPSGVVGEFLDVFVADRLVTPNWQLAEAYLRPAEAPQLTWTEPEVPGEAPSDSRFFKIGRADVDRDENGIPDVRESLTHVHDLPADARARWARAGLGGAPTNFATVLNVRQLGAKGNGTTDDTAAIAAVISQAPAGSVVYVPAGTYRLTQPLYLKSNMILRGDGAALTSLVFEGAGTAARCIGILRWDSNQPTTYVAVTDGMNFGSTTVTVSSVSGLQAGSIVELEEDNDPAWGFNEEWQLRLPGQLNRVVAVDTANRRLVLDRHLRHTFTSLRNPRLRALSTIDNVGVENLFIRRKDAVNGYTFEIKYAVRCWVRNVESYMTYKGHVWMERSYECEVRQSYLHDSYVFGGGGQGYGVGCGKHTSDCLIEDNVFRHLRHSMIVGNGANGNVYGYNFSTQRAIDPVYGTPQADISVHGNYVFMNLFEGNVLEDADVPDWYWPAGPGNTLFRNRIVNSGTAIDVGSDRQNFLGNVLTHGTIEKAAALEGVVDYGNVEQGDTASVGWTGCPCRNLPDSLYRSVPPNFILGVDGVSWPPIGPDEPLDSATPAKLRFSNGEY
jgi:hypothetical protein